MTFGEALREARLRAGLKQSQLARQLYVSPAQLCRIEKGERRASLELAGRADDVLGTGKRLREELAGSSHSTADAVASGELGPLVASQTPRGETVFVPASRRDFLTGMFGTALAGLGHSPAFGGESIKPAAYFRAARDTLISIDNLMGPRRAIPEVLGQLRELDAARRAARGIDGKELVHLQANFGELCGWMHQDLGDHQGARVWTDRALEWAHIAGDPELTAYVLSRKAHLASDMGDGQSAREIADAAVRIAPNSRLESIARVYGAHGFALEGAATETDRAYDLAHTAAAKPKGDATRGRWLDGNYIEAQRGRSLVALGRYHAAVDVFETAIATLPHGYRRDQGVYLARQALAHAGNHDGDAAATAGIEALQIAQETHSGRIATELSQLARVLPRGATGIAGTFHDRFSAAVSAE